MATGPTLPPQAYTREILSTAFNWLQSQPESVKKLATSPDALVGIYMRAQRFGNSSMETDAPVSSQNFMSDLKNLAEGLKEFDEPREKRPVQPQQAPIANGHASPSRSESLSSGFAQGLNDRSLHPRSLEMIREVKSQLNLSSDAEAVNMMVALAYKNLKNLLA